MVLPLMMTLTVNNPVTSATPKTKPVFHNENQFLPDCSGSAMLWVSLSEMKTLFTSKEISSQYLLKSNCWETLPN